MTSSFDVYAARGAVEVMWLLLKEALQGETKALVSETRRIIQKSSPTRCAMYVIVADVRR